MTKAPNATSTTCRHMSPVHAAKHYMQTHVLCTWSQALHADTCPLYMEPSTTCRHMSPVHAAKHYMQTHVPVHAAKHYMQTHVPCTCSQALHADTCPLYMEPCFLTCWLGQTRADRKIGCNPLEMEVGTLYSRGM